MRFIFYGPQGSGKSTQAKSLAAKLGIQEISTGEISRSLAAQDSEEGRLVKKLIDSGNQTPQEIIYREMEKVFDKPEVQKGFVLEGYPRYEMQLVPFLEQLKRRNWEIDKVFYIKLDLQEGIKRISLRAKTEGRNDDTPESITRRLELYETQTEPIVNYFRQQGKLVEIDGSGSIEEVKNLIDKNL